MLGWRVLRRHLIFLFLFFLKILISPINPVSLGDEMMDVKLQNGQRMPLVGLGTWQMKDDVCRNAVTKALKAGYKHIDTAEHYFNEDQVRKGIEDSGVAREDIFLTTKLWIDDFGYEETLKACDASLERLGTEYVDLYLIHWPISSSDIRSIMKAMKELLDAGKIRAFGVSNFTITHLKKAIAIGKELDLKISANQVEFHPGLYQKELLEFCKDNDIVLTAYSPLTRGDVSENETMKEIAEKYNKTPAQVALRWMTEKDVVVIPKASSEGHIKENIDIEDFTLDDEDAKRIDDMGSDNRLIVPPFAEFDKEDVFPDA